MKKIINLFFYILLVFIFAVPVIYTAYYSLKNNQQILSSYYELFFNCFSFYSAFWNSVIYSAVTIFFQLLIIIPASFAFIRLNNKIVNSIFVLYLVLMMMPLQVTLLPVYIGLRDFNLLDTRSSIIIPAVFSPIYVVIMKQYMTKIDLSIIESITLETNSLFRVIISGVIPQIKPCIYAIVFFSISETWNIYEEPVYFLKKTELMPISIFIIKISEYENGLVYSASVVCIIPMLLIYGIFSENLKEGIVISSEK